MKKLLVLLLAVSFTLTLAACNGEDDNTDPVVDNTAPVITGVDDTTVYLDTEFDPMEGVSATDDVDGDLTDSVEIIGSVDTSQTGSNYLRYRVTDAAGNISEESRFVTVEVDPSSVGDEFVPNGNFDLGMSFWSVTQGLEGGAGNFNVVDGVLEIEITGVSGGLWEPRLENIGMTFEEGKTYKVSFDAKADAPRSVHLQVGELLDSAPWFNNFKEGQTEIVDLTTEMTNYDYTFTMTKETNENGAVIFEMGTVEGEVGTDNLLTTVYLDNVMVEETEPVYSEPIIMTEDITIEVGTEWDPLDGVIARDLVEGDLDLTMDNVIRDEVDPMVEGEYEVEYSVSNSEGLTTTHIRTITVVSLIFNDTDIVTNGDFSEALDEETPVWRLFEANWSPDESPMTDGDLEIIDGEMVLSVKDIGAWGEQAWLLQAAQDIELELGHTYRVEFIAKADSPRALNSVVGFTALNDEWVGYGSSLVDLTDEYQTYSYTFTVDQDSDDFQVELKFEFGNGVDTVYVDDVNIDILDEGPTSTNSSFEETGWGVWSQDWANDNGVPNVTHGIENEEYFVTADNLGDANWAIQFLQEGLSVVDGETYSVTLDARASAARDINFKFIDANGKEFLEVISLTETMDTYTFDFVYEGDATSGKISIELGVIGDATPGTIWFDNIEMNHNETNLVTNGTFDQIVDWGTWAQDWDDAPTVTTEVINGELVMAMDKLGAESWSIQLFQNDVSLIPGGSYRLLFDMKAEVARDINAKIITGSGEIAETFTLTTDMQTYIFDFEYTINEDTGNINFEFGNFENAEAGAITVDNVILFRTFN